ncbi:hypothetical protein REPUB_Repub08aG0149900 [Reevesia pubescens]
MGDCASKPKASDIPEKPQLQTAALDNTNGGEKEIEKPSVDLSEPEKEAQASSSEPKAAAAAAEPVSIETVAETQKTTEDDVKVAAKNVEDKVEVNDNTTVVPAKEEDDEAEADDKPNAAPSKELKEVKSDAPLVSL